MTRTSNRQLPRIAPLTLKQQREPFDHPDWVFELKQDGFRGMAYIAEGKSKLISRTDHVFQSFGLLRKLLANLPVQNAIIDGEIVCLDDEGVSQFNELMFKRGVPYFYAFDLVWLNDHDLRHLTLIQRKEKLQQLILGADNPALLYADHVEEYGCDFFKMICERNLEGIAAKHRESPYSKSAKWIKIKNPNYTQSEGRHELFDKARGR
jgi:bifunctional non-homologous end joining protein LigD